jgi:hypothetical protein
VAIRAVIRRAMDNGLPIPILGIWGGRKTNPAFSIDIAEVSAVRMLTCLNERVSRFYPQGVHVRIRIEDLGAHYLFADEGATSREATIRYTDDFMRFIRILDLGYLDAIPESTLADEAEYFSISEAMVPTVLAYMLDTEQLGHDDPELASRKALAAIGWQGGIPFAQRDYYHRLYTHLYPHDDHAQRIARMARYFAGALARYKLKMLGDLPEWNGEYLKFSLVPPVPGAPEGMVSRNLYSRTVPLAGSKNHIAPWRAKGYLKMVGAVARPAVTGWRDELLHDLLPGRVNFCRGGERVTVDSDYLIPRKKPVIYD